MKSTFECTYFFIILTDFKSQYLTIFHIKFYNVKYSRTFFRTKFMYKINVIHDLELFLEIGGFTGSYFNLAGLYDIQNW